MGRRCAARGSADLFQVGVVGYTSQKLYGPEDKDGTRLLATGQEPITVLGEAFGAMRILGQTITGYRQLVNRPFINPQDNRMVPNTFEAYTLTGAVDKFSYTGGYITKMKARNTESFVWMSNTAGGTGKQEGVIYAGGTWDYAKNGYVRIDEQYGVDVFNTFYIDGKYPIAIDDKTSLAWVRSTTRRARSATPRSVRSRRTASDCRARSRTRPVGGSSCTTRRPARASTPRTPSAATRPIST